MKKKTFSVFFVFGNSPQLQKRQRMTESCEEKFRYFLPNVFKPKNTIKNAILKKWKQRRIAIHWLLKIQVRFDFTIDFSFSNYANVPVKHSFRVTTGECVSFGKKSIVRKSETSINLGSWSVLPRGTSINIIESLRLTCGSVETIFLLFFSYHFYKWRALAGVTRSDDISCAPNQLRRCCVSRLLRIVSAITRSAVGLKQKIRTTFSSLSIL